MKFKPVRCKSGIMGSITAIRHGEAKHGLYGGNIGSNPLKGSKIESE